MNDKDPAQGRVLRSWLSEQVLPTFSERILSVDTLVAQTCAGEYLGLFVRILNTSEGCCTRQSSDVEE